MGRHSKPDPEDSADEPLTQRPAEHPGQPREIGELDEYPLIPLAHDHEGFEYLDTYPDFDEPTYSDPLSNHHYPGADHTFQLPPRADNPAYYDYYPTNNTYPPNPDIQLQPHTDDPADYDHYPTNNTYPPNPDDDYPDFPRRPASSAARPKSPTHPTSPRVGASHRGLGDWRGGHRSVGGRRGVSIGVIATLVTVLVVVAGVIVWRFFGNALSNRSQTAAASCVSGNDTVAVIVDPSIAEHVKDFADDYNASSGPIGDRCVDVTVKPAGADAVIAGFIGKWPPELGNRPGLWLPGSSISAARLNAAAGKKTISDSRSLVTSPVLLAVRPELEQALTNQNWAALPGLQTDPNAMTGLGLPAWGSLRLALPIAGNSDASLLAGEAIAAASAPAGDPPTAGSDAVRKLVSGQPKLADDSLTAAMNALLKSDNAATGPVHAVVTTEQQVFERGQSMSDAESKLGSWRPPGPVAVADYPTVLLNGSWLSEEQTTAASAFARFMHKPEQLAKLAKAGFRVEGVKSPSSPVTSFATLPSPLSVGDDGMRATLATTMTSPSAGVATTIMLDQSLPTEEGGKTRLANVVAALNNRIKALPPSSVVGLWTFDGREERTEVRAGPLADRVNGQPRSTALTTALDKQSSSEGGAVSFTTLRLIYREMLSNFHEGQANSVLVITAGPHTDQTLDGAGLQAFVRANVDPAKPIAINIIDFGSDADRATWESVATLSGGSYQNLKTSASPSLAKALDAFLG